MYELEKSCYEAYKRMWYDTHNEGEPACFYEFLGNEFQDKDIMHEIIKYLQEEEE